MFIDDYLNENSSLFYGDVQPALNESWITGENENELSIISGQFNREVFAIQENFLFAQGLAYVAEVQGKKTDILSEAFGGFFASIGKRIKEMWEKVKAFFVKLFKSISISLGDIEKSLKNVEKHLEGKSFTNFTYQGHNWNVGTGEKIANEVGSNIKSAINSTNTTVKIILNKASSATNGSSVIDDSSEATKRAYTAANFGLSYGEDLTLEQVKIDIKKKYGNNESAKEIKGLNNWSAMVKFLREFNKNKALTDLQKISNELYSSTLSTIQETQNKIEQLSPQSSVTDSGKIDSTKTALENAKKNATAEINGLASIMGQYNTIMQFCIAEEKAIFSEYKSVIAKAVKFKG